MTKENKAKIKIENSIKRRQKKKIINSKHISRNKMDCPYDVDMNGLYGTCHCGGLNYDSCCGDI